MAGKKRTNKQILADDAQISELYLQGYTQMHIAETVGVSQPTVSRAIQRIEDRWLKSSLVNFHEAKMRHLAQTRYVFEEAKEAWETSKELKRTISRKGVGTGDGGDRFIPTSVETKSEERDGTGSFLDVMLKCIKQEGEILGYRRGIDDIDVTQNNFFINADRLSQINAQAADELNDWVQGRFSDHGSG